MLTSYATQKAAGQKALQDRNQFKDKREEMARLDALVRDPPPDYVARAKFYLAVMQYEDGKFGEAQAQLTAFIKDFPKSPLLTEADSIRMIAEASMAHREVLAAMVQHVHFVGIEEQAAGFVMDEGVVVPGVPQSLDYLDEFGGAVVTAVMIEPIDAREVEFLLPPAADDVHAHLPFRDFRHGVEHAGNEEG